MANIRIKQALERIGSEMSRIRTQTFYSGITAKDARIIDNMATDIAVEAAEIAAEARNVLSGRLGQDANRNRLTLLSKVRKALGFTYP